MIAPTIRAELTTAIRVLNGGAYARLTAEQQDRIHFACDGPLAQALLMGDQSKGFSAIEAWRDRQLADLAEAER